MGVLRLIPRRRWCAFIKGGGGGNGDCVVVSTHYNIMAKHGVLLLGVERCPGKLLQLDLLLSGYVLLRRLDACSQARPHRHTDTQTQIQIQIQIHI